MSGTARFVACIVTGRNEVVAKVIFLHLSVILFTGGGSASVHAGIPPAKETPPLQRRHPPAKETPLPLQAHTQGEN